MRKWILFLLFTIVLVIFGANSRNIIFKSETVIAKLLSTPKSNLVADVENVTFDKKQVILWCPYSLDENYCPKDEQNVRVTSVVKNPENANLTYYYIASGGLITGEGANVVWDFTDMKPGKYTLTVGVGDDYVVRGKTVTKTIELAECDVCDPPPPPCRCPSHTVAGPINPVKPGDSVIFAAKVEYPEFKEQKPIAYKWTISGGTIINGQGTPRIMVKTSADTADKSVTASLETNANSFECNCVPGSRTISITNEK